MPNGAFTILVTAPGKPVAAVLRDMTEDGAVLPLWLMPIPMTRELTP